MTRRSGWFGESQRHSLASRGVKTGQKSRSMPRHPRPKPSTPEAYWQKVYDKDPLKFLYFEIEEDAYEEGKDEAGALLLMSDYHWVSDEVSDLMKKYNLTPETKRDLLKIMGFPSRPTKTSDRIAKQLGGKFKLQVKKGNKIIENRYFSTKEGAQEWWDTATEYGFDPRYEGYTHRITEVKD